MKTLETIEKEKDTLEQEIDQSANLIEKLKYDKATLFDNVIAQHGRQPWGGEQADRVVLASLFDGQVPGAYCDEDWAQVVQALDG